MIITELKFNKKGTFDIFADGDFICDITDETVYKLKLVKGMEISEDEIETIKELSQEQGAKRTGARLLSAAMKSRYDFEKKLMEKGFNKTAVKKAADFFEEKGFLDDVSYARSYVADAVKLKKYGASKIRMMLKSKGIAEDVISELLESEEENEYNNLKSFVRREFEKTDEISKKSVDKIKRRLYAKGYDIGDIIKAINEIRREYDES